MNQESLFPDIKTEKVFKPKSIFAATFFGGPLVAGYLIASNYKALDDRNNEIKTWIFTIAGTLAVIILSFFISYRSSRNIPGYILPIIYSTITYNVVNLVQKNKLASYISSGGQLHSSGRVFAVTIAGAVVTFIGALILANIWDFINF